MADATEIRASSACRRPHATRSVSWWSCNGTSPEVAAAVMEHHLADGAVVELQRNITGGRRCYGGASPDRRCRGAVMKHCRTADVGGASLQPRRSFQRPPRRFTATSPELHCNLAGAPTTAVALHCNLAGASLQPQPCSMVAPRRPPTKLHCSVTTTFLAVVRVLRQRG